MNAEIWATICTIVATPVLFIVPGLIYTWYALEHLTVCVECVRQLGAKTAELRARRTGLEYDVLDADPPRITRRDLAKVRRQVADTIASGAPEAKKALLQALVAEIRVESRKAVRPFLRVPIDATTAEAPDQQKKVRTPSGSVSQSVSAPGRIRTCAPGSGG